MIDDTPVFWSAPYQKEILAKIVEVNENELRFNQALFYPSGGGQPHDLGTMRYQGCTLPIIEVYTVDREIWHKTDSKEKIDFQVDEDVQLELNWNHRYNLMKSHTAQHLLSYFLQEMYECETIKANFDEGKIEIEISKALNLSDVVRVLEKSNNRLEEDADVKSIIVNQKAFQEEYKSKIRGKTSDEKRVRMIQLGDFDLVCCGGVHVKKLSEVRGIFLETVKNRVLKLYTGEKGINYTNRQRANLHALEEITEKKDSKLFELVKNKLKENENLEEGNILLLKLLFQKINIWSEKIQNYSVVLLDIPTLDRITVQAALKELKEEMLIAIIGRNAILYIISTNEHIQANGVIDKIKEKTGAKGGGNKGFAQMSVKDIKEPLQLVREVLSSL
ncbi:MAG: alanyl-tRNA editing protein [Candidatus Heimdallarchaeota archaeon]|nr:alanyl-tRNA editing protein [Candidatus Heimdallarchaeota archaeon]